MKCEKCFKPIQEDFVFCPYCGSRVAEVSEETVGYRMKQHKYDDNLVNARKIYEVYKRGAYMERYANLKEYGKKELGLGKTQTYIYKNVGEKFVDAEGKLRLNTDQDWTVAMLQELLPDSLSDVQQWIDEGLISAEMKPKELRAVVKQLRANC